MVIRPLTLAALLATSLITSGCDLDTLRGEKSAAQKWHEHRNPVVDNAPPAAVATLVSTNANIASVEVAEPLPVVVPVVECVGDEFRVSRCVEGKVMPW